MVASNPEDFPNSIRAIREARGLSQQALADLIGTSQPQIDRLERGTRRLTVDWMAKLASALKVRGSDLVWWNEEPTESLLLNSRGTKSFKPAPLIAEADAVPLYTSVPHTTRKDMFILPDVAIGSVSKPPGILKGDEVFALHNPNGAMSPRWELGELLFISRRLSPPKYGLSLLLFNSNPVYGDRAALFCRSGVPAFGAIENTIQASFYVDRIDQEDLYKNVFPTELIAERLFVYDWPQLLGV